MIKEQYSHSAILERNQIFIASLISIERIWMLALLLVSLLELTIIKVFLKCNVALMLHLMQKDLTQCAMKGNLYEVY